ncbi:hypothetical protein [Sphingomonas sp. 28-63-12]|uniref:hypothetical protein n=1 Tax=Sphingomonas sp. 28-63-12 TaxID=1970434 RepID=UPI000BD06088|nr:MAG: hypothetical protein B7Y47_02515 [Sphingomonas sp. 28-63-12]
MNIASQRPPRWFWVVALLLLLWSAAGVFAYYAHMTVDQKTLAAMSAYDRAAYLRLPVWFGYVFALAVLPALAGAVALLLRSKFAWPLYALSLIGVIVQFGWVFGATDLIAAKGAAATVPFPLMIFVLAVVQLWLAGVAIRRRWIS